MWEIGREIRMDDRPRTETRFVEGGQPLTGSLSAGLAERSKAEVQERRVGGERMAPDAAGGV